MNPVVKAVLILLGGVVALGVGVVAIQWVFALAFLAVKAAFVLGTVGAVGYLGYRALNRQPALPGRNRAALPPSNDYESRMRELERIEKALDAEISRR
ncbi:MAG: hypothetical protein R3A51_19830 [Nannocystaceae bacterium]|nr:hypothetical protein [Myxococcales bacterium]